MKFMVGRSKLIGTVCAALVQSSRTSPNWILLRDSYIDNSGLFSDFSFRQAT